MYVVIRKGGYEELTEMPRADYVAGDHAGREMRYVPAAEAHRWVRSGKLHSTGLYVNAEGRVRYARPNT